MKNIDISLLLVIP
jgi:hypothetical protein